MRFRSRALAAVVIGVLAAILAACSPATDGAGSASPAAAPATPAATMEAPTSTVTEQPTPTDMPIDWSRVEAAAAGFMAERQARDVGAAQAYLSEDVYFDWGPNDGRDGLAAAWAWEDAFRLVHTLDECKGLREGFEPVARCRLRVDSEVAAAVGSEPGFVCIDVTVDRDLITRVIGLDPVPGCAYNYGSQALGPFARWLETAHPETSFDVMYDDRTSTAGVERWRQYTSEFIADRSG